MQYCESAHSTLARPSQSRSQTTLGQEIVSSSLLCDLNQGFYLSVAYPEGVLLVLEHPPPPLALTNLSTVWVLPLVGLGWVLLVYEICTPLRGVLLDCMCYIRGEWRDIVGWNPEPHPRQVCLGV